MNIFTDVEKTRKLFHELLPIGKSFDVIEKLIKQNNKANIGGYTVYMLDSNILKDIIKIDVDGKFYCIFLDNKTTHDNVVICCNDRNVAVHMANSIDYK